MKFLIAKLMLGSALVLSMGGAHAMCESDRDRQALVSAVFEDSGLDRAANNVLTVVYPYMDVVPDASFMSLGYVRGNIYYTLKATNSKTGELITKTWSRPPVESNVDGCLTETTGRLAKWETIQFAGLQWGVYNNVSVTASQTQTRWYGSGHYPEYGPTYNEQMSFTVAFLDGSGDSEGAEEAAGIVLNIVNEVAEVAEGYVEYAQEEAEKAEQEVNERLADVYTLIGQIEEEIGRQLAVIAQCTEDPNNCPPTGGAQEVGEDVIDEVNARKDAAIAQAMAAVAEAERQIEDLLLIVGGVGGDLEETGKAVQDMVNNEIEFIFGQLNGTLTIVFNELNFIVGMLPGAVQGTVQFVVATANSEAELLVGLTQETVLFAVGVAEGGMNSALATAEIVRKAAVDIANQLPLYDNEQAYHTLIDQTFFALDNLVLRFLDEERAADRAVFAARHGLESVLRAGAGYTHVVKRDAQVDGAQARDTTLAVSGAGVQASVDIGYAVFSATGYEAIYEDLMCNRLGLCEAGN